MRQIMGQALVMQKGSKRVAALQGAQGGEERLAGGQANCTMQCDMCFDGGVDHLQREPWRRSPSVCLGKSGKAPWRRQGLSYDLKVTRSLLDSQERESITGQGRANVPASMRALLCSRGTSVP